MRGTKKSRSPLLSSYGYILMYHDARAQRERGITHDTKHLRREKNRTTITNSNNVIASNNTHLMERTDVLCPGVGLEVLQDHGFDDQSRFRLFFPVRRRRRRIWWSHRLSTFFFNLRHQSLSLSLCSQQQKRARSMILLQEHTCVVFCFVSCRANEKFFFFV